MANYPKKLAQDAAYQSHNGCLTGLWFLPKLALGLNTNYYYYMNNNEVLLRVKEQGDILHEISKRKANWIGHVLRRNCVIQRVIEGKIKGGIEVTGRRGRRRGKLLDDLKERTGYSYLKEEALDRNMWRARYGRGFGPVVRQTSFIHSVFCLTTGPKPPPKRFLHIVRSTASSFK